MGQLRFSSARNKKNKNKSYETWDMIKHKNIYRQIHTQIDRKYWEYQKEKRERGKRIFEGIMIENFPSCLNKTESPYMCAKNEVSNVYRTKIYIYVIYNIQSSSRYSSD